MAREIKKELEMLTEDIIDVIIYKNEVKGESLGFDFRMDSEWISNKF